MKRFVINLLLYVFFAVPVYFITICFLGLFVSPSITPNLKYSQGYVGNLYTRLNEFRKVKGTLDLLFLGSSHSYREIDTRNFANYKCFNLGSSAQTPIQTKLLLERYLDRIKTRAVIWEVNPDAFSSDGVESALDLVSNDRNDLLSVQMAMEINDPKVYNTLIYGFFRDITNLNSSFSEPKQTGVYTYIPGGYVKRKFVHFKRPKFSKKIDFKVNPVQLNAFENIIQMLKSKNISVILVSAPITNELYESFSNYKQFDSLIKGYDVEFYDFNRILSLKDSLYFYDSQHLNQHGVNVYNQKLIELLENKEKLLYPVQ